MPRNLEFAASLGTCRGSTSFLGFILELQCKNAVMMVLRFLVFGAPEI